MKTQLEQKAWDALRRYNMLQKGDSIAVGVSGGADSVALFDFLCSVRRRLELTLTVCHVNHNLRGAESLRDEAFVRELAAERGAEFRLLTVDAAALAREQGRGVEEAARDLRYGFFAETAGERGRIATAHTLDDSVETFLFRLARGTGAKGLRGIPPVRGNIIRPLIGCTRAEVEDHLNSRGLGWVEDSTNREDYYARNRIRHHVIPALLEVNSAAPQAIAGAMERLAALQELAQDLAAEAERDLRLRGGGYDAQGLLELPQAVGDCLLLGLLEKAGLPQSSRAAAGMRQALAAGGEIDLGRGMVFRSWRGRALVTPREAAPPAILRELDLSREKLPLFLPLGGGKTLKVGIIARESLENPEKINKRDLIFLANYAKISNTAILRQKQDGDRIALPGRGRRLLKKLYQEAGIAPARRAAMLVLCDSEGPFWAEGFGFDRRATDAGAEEYLTVTVLEEVENGTHHA